MAEEILRIERLRKSYGALCVTDDLSFGIVEGELHAVIGPNGAGKTTLVEQICGFAAPDAGRILFGGRDITALPAHRRARLGLARSFQITSVLERFSAMENVALAVQARSGSSFRFLSPASLDRTLNEEAMAALDQVGLTKAAARPAGALSHGEQRQLELAIALAMKPRLLILDEPLAGASHAESAGLVALLDRLKGQLTMVLIEHDMDAVFTLADRVTVLVYGRALATGRPENVRADPDVRLAYLGEEA